MSYNEIHYIGDELHGYNDRMTRLEQIENQSEMNGNATITDEAKQLKIELQDITIPRVANVEVAANNDQQRLSDWETKVDELDRRNTVSINPQLKRIFDEIGKVNSSVYNDSKINYVIDGLPESERREYYEELYNFIVNHLLSYNILYKGYYVDNTANYEDISLVFEEVSFKQPITKKIPIFNEIVKCPYLIIEKELNQQVHTLNKNVSHKVGTSTFRD